MPLFLVQRTYLDGLDVTRSAENCSLCSATALGLQSQDTTWLHSLVSADRSVVYCVYEAPSADSIRRISHDAGLPVDLITEVTVLIPLLHHTNLPGAASERDAAMAPEPPRGKAM